MAGEFSGIVRDAFLKRGHEAVSCDLFPSERPGPHIQGDVRYLDFAQFDLMIAHPPCTHLAVSGARWFRGKEAEQVEALAFVEYLLSRPVPRIALENPVSVISTKVRRPDQVIQPWQFGHGEVKATCLWLKGLPKLTPTDVVAGRVARVHREPPGPERWRNRSRTFEGIAAAMADQWGEPIIEVSDGSVVCSSCGPVYARDEIAYGNTWDKHPEWVPGPAEYLRQRHARVHS